MGKRLSAAAALESPWVREGGCAPDTPLEGTVVQRLQRHATYGHLKQLVRAQLCPCQCRARRTMHASSSALISGCCSFHNGCLNML